MGNITKCSQAEWKDVLNFNLENIFNEFHSEHNRQFGYSLKEEKTELELINVRLRVIGKNEKPKFLSENVNRISLESALKEHREVYIPETERMEKVPVYDGDASIFGAKIAGPCVIEKITTSIFVSKNYDCVVDDFGSFVVYEKEKFPQGFKLKEKNIVSNAY